MRVRVTGGAGYIGSQTAKYHSQSGHEPIVLDDFSTGRGRAVKSGQLFTGTTGNRRLMNQVLANYQPEAIGWTTVHSDLETIVSTAWEWMVTQSDIQSMAIGSSA